MANENETVEQVCEDLEKYICGDDDIVYSLTGDEAIEYKDRILAAHKRELAAKDAEIAKLRKALSRVQGITGDCRKCEECGDESCPWYGEPDGCNNREAREKFLRGELADPIEREGKCEKKYEYSAKNNEGFILTTHFDFDAIKEVYGNQECFSIVRREVGEWEEVKV